MFGSFIKKGAGTMNPIWIQQIADAVVNVTRRCTHCGKTSKYQRKSAGQFYKCRRCGHRFKEKGR